MPSRILPELLTNDVLLCQCSRDARFLFFCIALHVDDSHRLLIGPSRSRPLFVKSRCLPFDDVRASEVSRWLHELEQAGAIAVHESLEGTWLEVAERLRYRREDYSERQPKYGPRKLKQAKQAELPFGPLGLVEGSRPGPAEAPGENLKGVGYESKTKTQTGGPAALSPASCAQFVPNPAPSGRSATSLPGAESAGPSWTPMDDVWLALHRACGLVEMTANQALWKIRFGEDYEALREAVFDFTQKPPAERAKINPGAYITARYQALRERAAG